MAKLRRRVEQHLVAEEKSRPGRAILEFIGVIVLVLALMTTLRHFVAQRFYIPSPSMASTIDPGDYVLASKLTPQFVPLQRGDVVVFNDSGQWLGQTDPVELSALDKTLIFVGLKTDPVHQQLIKRVIGLPGDEVKCCSVNGKLLVNDIEINEDYINGSQPPSLVEFQVKVPEGRLWVMGDNRSHSADSRSHMTAPGGGTVPISDVLGKAVAVIWPFNRIGFIDSSPQTFAPVGSE